MAHRYRYSAKEDPHISDRAPGYMPNGESQHSRRSARGFEPGRIARQLRFKTPGYHSLHELIGETERQIEWLECELKIADTPTRRAKLAKNLEIKGKFLTRLLVEAEALRGTS